MVTFDYRPDTRVLFGNGSIDKLGAIVRQMKSQEVLIITDQGILDAGHVDRAIRSLKKESLNIHLFKEVEENPTTIHVDNGVLFAKETNGIDLIVGLGGGSAMDCAKGINFLLTNGGKMEDYRGINKATKPMLPSIGIPTTAGTGSEAQSYALIVHAETRQKMACGDWKARFKVAILDPELLKSVPYQVATATGIDAISHALESYVTTRKNPVSQLFSGEAWRLLEKNFDLVLRDPENIKAWGNMLLGAHWAGHAIENSMLGAAHACANPLTSRYGIVHGVAVGLMLPHIIQFNSNAVNGLYRNLIESAKLAGSTGEPGVETLISRINEIKKRTHLPKNLSELSVKKKDLSKLADEASQQWTGKFNPCPVEKEDYLMLYEAAY